MSRERIRPARPISGIGRYFPAGEGGGGGPPIWVFDPDKSFGVCDKSVLNLLICVNSVMSINCQFAYDSLHADYRLSSI